MRQAQASPGWPRRQEAIENKMNGLIDTGMWDEVPCPAKKLVVGTKILLERKTDAREEEEKEKSRLVVQGFQQLKRT